MTGPLTGLRVADFSWFVAAPLAARTLANFGADVIRIESEARVDGIRLAQPISHSGSGVNVSGFFNNFNPGKRSLLLNMSEPDARDIALRLIRVSDVFITNFTPRVINKWRLGYDDLHEVNPRIIALYTPMQGLSGPQKDFLGFGAVLASIAGLSYLSGFPHRAPFGVGTNYPDYTINPGHAVIAIMAALRHRDRTGEGQEIELSQFESVAATIGPALMDYSVNNHIQQRTGNRLPAMAPHGAFRCMDEERRHEPLSGQPTKRERWIVIAIDSNEQWRSLCQLAAGMPFTEDKRFQTLLGRKRYEDDLERLISNWTLGCNADFIVEQMQTLGIPSGVVQDAEDVLTRDEHLAAREYYVRLDHSEAGNIAHDGVPARLHQTPGEVRGPAPLLGQHTYEIMTDVLGYSSDEVSDFVARSILS